jgi:hypothetical protein
MQVLGIIITFETCPSQKTPKKINSQYMVFFLDLYNNKLYVRP